MLISTPLQPTTGIQGPIPPLPHQKIDSSQTGAVLGRDLHLEASQPSQPILMRSHIDDTDHAVQEDLSPIQNVFRKTN